jgi:hypothetical protein
MNDRELYRHEGWQWCTAEGAEMHTLLQGLHSSFREKLEWLEEAETLTLRLHGQPEGIVVEEAGPYGAAKRKVDGKA